MCYLSSYVLKSVSNFLASDLQRWQHRFVSLLCLVLSFGLMVGAIGTIPQAAYAILPAANVLKDGRAALRDGLPFENQDIRNIQAEIEEIVFSLRGLRWSSAQDNVSDASRTLTLFKGRILADAPAANRDRIEALLKDISAELIPLQAATDRQDIDATFAQRSRVLELISEVEELMVGEFPFEVPAKYSDLPQLKGRATIEIETERGNLVAIVDGYNAPITAGNFVDLVQRGFYDGLPITRVEENYVVQFGDPPGSEDGFIDPDTGEYRTIPLEIMLKADTTPIYEFTLETLGLYLEPTALPFATYGTLGMAYPSNDVNGGSSQVFFFLYEPDIARAGANLIDGFFTAFGYVVEGEKILDTFEVGDLITKMSVVDGFENLVEPSV